MIQVCLIRWNNINDKDYSDSSKYVVLNAFTEIGDPNVIGLDPDLEYLVLREPYVSPDYDGRIYSLNTIFAASAEIDDQYPPLRKFVTTYETVRRTPADIKASIKEAEALSNSQIIDPSAMAQLMFLRDTIQRRSDSGIAITADEQVVINNYNDIGAKVWANSQNAKTLCEMADAGTLISINIGWITQ
jgi:hypothetical protein